MSVSSAASVKLMFLTSIKWNRSVCGGNEIDFGSEWVDKLFRFLDAGAKKTASGTSSVIVKKTRRSESRIVNCEFLWSNFPIKNFY